MQQSPKDVFQNALQKIGITLGIPNDVCRTISVEPPKNDAFGDYASSAALMCVTKQTSYKTPLDLAEAYVTYLKDDATLKPYFSTFQVAAPGFINATLSATYYQTLLTTIISQKDQFGSNTSGKGKTAVVDLSAPNIAKRFSIGHLRSTIIGDAIVKLLRFQGWRVIGDNHLGDWGTQFGKMIVAVRLWADKPVGQLSIPELEDLYVRFHKEAEQHPELDDQARAAFKALEDGNKEERELWQILVDNSMKEFATLYRFLDVQIDEAYGESAYEGMMRDVIKIATQKGIAEKSQDALIIPFPPDAHMPPGILLKKDGATTYFTRDLATVLFRKNTWHPDRIIYEVGAEQSLHLRQVFWASELLGFGTRDMFVHVAHGFVRLKDGRMSTRKGNAIKLDDVLNKMVDKAKTINPDDAVAQTIGVGALKYNDLKRTPGQGYTFDWDEALTLNGNSGPYLQYTAVRCKGILEKGRSADTRDTTGSRHDTPYDPNPEERAVARLLSQFPEIIVTSAALYAPSTLCTYLYTLAQKFSSFYETHSVTQAETPEAKAYRLLLTESVMIVLTNGLTLLGIRVPERM